MIIDPVNREPKVISIVRLSVRLSVCLFPL